MIDKISKYEQQADNLVKAIDIAEQVINESVDFVVELKNPMLALGAEKRQSLKHPEIFSHKLKTCGSFGKSNYYEA